MNLSPSSRLAVARAFPMVYVEGAMPKIRSGPFATFDGEIVGEEGDSYRVAVTVFGKMTSVLVPKGDIDVAPAPIPAQPPREQTDLAGSLAELLELPRGRGDLAAALGIMAQWDQLDAEGRFPYGGPGGGKFELDDVKLHAYVAPGGGWRLVFELLGKGYDDEAPVNRVVEIAPRAPSTSDRALPARWLVDPVVELGFEAAAWRVVLEDAGTRVLGHLWGVWDEPARAEVDYLRPSASPYWRRVAARIVRAP